MMNLTGDTRYKCLLCGRNKFTHKTSHYCRGGYRKRGLKWEKINNMENSATIGILADNFKLNKFKKELDKANFTDYKIADFTANTSIINIDMNADRIKELKKLCEKVEFYFKRGNQKE